MIYIYLRNMEPLLYNVQRLIGTVWDLSEELPVQIVVLQEKMVGIMVLLEIDSVCALAPVLVPLVLVLEPLVLVLVQLGLVLVLLVPRVVSIGTIRIVPPFDHVDLL